MVSNLDWDAVRLLPWHREKAGTVEHAHDELKNGLAAGHMPSQRFAVNATWLKLAIMTLYNIASAIKGLCFSPEERTARFKKYRLLLVHVAGRMNRNNCVMRLRLCAAEQHHARIEAVWKVFWLPTTSFTHRALAACGARLLADSARAPFSEATATPTQYHRRRPPRAEACGRPQPASAACSLGVVSTSCSTNQLRTACAPRRGPSAGPFAGPARWRWRLRRGSAAKAFAL